MRNASSRGMARPLRWGAQGRQSANWIGNRRSRTWTTVIFGIRLAASLEERCLLLNGIGMSESERRFVLLTGAAGRIGTAFREAHGEQYRFRLADLDADVLADTPGTDHEVVRLDIADADACREACAGIDTVVHLAADPSPEADWESSLLPNNVRGTVNIFRAAHEAGCRRVVFASSVHAFIGYPPGETLADDASPRPVNLYGASKVFGEAVVSRFS